MLPTKSNKVVPIDCCKYLYQARTLFFCHLLKYKIITHHSFMASLINLMILRLLTMQYPVYPMARMTALARPILVSVSALNSPSPHIAQIRVKNAVTQSVFPDICWNFQLDAYLSNSSPIMSEKHRIIEQKNSPNVKGELFKMSGEMTAASNMTYPITNTTNKFFNAIYSLNLELAFRMSLISRVTNTSNQSKAKEMNI